MAGAGGAVSQRLELHWRPLACSLPAPLRTAAGTLAERRGWLLRLETADGAVGWGEATPLATGAGGEALLERCGAAVQSLNGEATRPELERGLPLLPPPVAFAVGAALAEAEGLVGEGAGGWRAAPPSAWLLPAGAEGLAGAGERRAAAGNTAPGFGGGRAGGLATVPFTVKWKVGVHDEEAELAWLEQLLERLPADARLRLDANGGWGRATAGRWAERLAGEPRLEWLEQPLDPADQEGLEALAERLPVALDESLLLRPALRERWRGWQVRRPSQEGDPRPLLRALAAGQPRWMVSTSFETGLGQRWLAHLAALQAAGPTPVAPGLAPGWRLPGGLGSGDPQEVWRAAGAATAREGGERRGDRKDTAPAPERT
ncbi:MAG: o-succinylbenzoate synthase [Cyanobacteriota bacterium]|nr:o-succinylbenzoate synthase [Cyanobacteriota bacterium]